MEIQKPSLIPIILCFFGMCFNLILAKEGSYKVHCSEDLMRIEIVMSDEQLGKTEIYLDGLRGYPNIKCKPVLNGSLAEFQLSLKNFYECGITRMINKITGKTVYYHKIVVDDEKSNEILKAKCITNGPLYTAKNPTHRIVQRDVLPIGFQEPENLEITTSLTGNAPEPILGVGVRQGSKLITGELNVSPGTPLTMEIYLDKDSASVYGLGVTYMEVTDTKSQEETIIFNGCSVDPYLFENFNTTDGDFLSAKFRAFKFPESTYVQFRATVNVCLNKCQGTTCSNGQIGYGRRKREIKTFTDPHKIYEISLTAFIKVSDDKNANVKYIL